MKKTLATEIGPPSFIVNHPFLIVSLAIFLATAAFAAWAAYDPWAAWAKFGMLLLGILLFFLIAGLRSIALWRLARWISVVGGIFAALFLLTYDYLAHPVDIGWVNRIGTAWTVRRPEFLGFFPNLSTDTVSGLLALALFFPLVTAWNDWRKSPGKAGMRSAWFFTLTAVLMLAAMVGAAETGLWFALAATLTISGWAWISYRLQPSPQKGTRFFMLGLLFLGGILLVVGLLLNSGWSSWLDHTTSLSNAHSRLVIWRNSLLIVKDFPFTGGGLESFSGLYSEYILAVPYAFTYNSHNLFLEVAVEQGLFGLAALVAVLAASVSNLARSLHHEDGLRLLRVAVLAGIFLLVLNGAFETILYDRGDAWALFLLPGWAVALAPSPRPATQRVHSIIATRPAPLTLILGALVVLVTLGWGRGILAGWYANLGAVQMARQQLQDFPLNRWRDDPPGPELAPAVRFLERAIQLDPRLPAAHYRLGMLAYQDEQFEDAVLHLQTALDESAGSQLGAQPGMIKLLGYSLVWTGDIAQAQALLRRVPAVREELKVYRHWWSVKGQNDLAEAAAQMVALLPEDGSG